MEHNRLDAMFDEKYQVELKQELIDYLDSIPQADKSRIMEEFNAFGRTIGVREDQNVFSPLDPIERLQKMAMTHFLVALWKQSELQAIQA